MTKKMQTWRPFGDLWDLQDDVNRLFWGFGKRGYGYDDEASLAAWAPAVDICEDNEAVRISAELPGMTQNDVKLAVKDGVLTIRGERGFKDEQKKKDYYRIERSYGTFARSFTLPSTVEADKIHAEMKDGVCNEALVMPSSTGSPCAGALPSSARRSFSSSNSMRSI